MRYSSSVILLVAVCGCSVETEVSPKAATKIGLLPITSYRIDKLPSLGGTLSRGMAINDRGWVAGWSNRADGSRHAALWKNGTITDLLTLGGPSSTVPWPGLNDDGMVVGVSHTAEIDPLDEDWSCEAGGFLPGSTNLVCRGFVWSGGEMRELPTLGGHHGFGAGNRSASVRRLSAGPRRRLFESNRRGDSCRNRSGIRRLVGRSPINRCPCYHGS